MNLLCDFRNFNVQIIIDDLHHGVIPENDGDFDSSVLCFSFVSAVVGNGSGFSISCCAEIAGVLIQSGILQHEFKNGISSACGENKIVFLRAVPVGVTGDHDALNIF